MTSHSINSETRPHFHALLQKCKQLPSLKTAVVCPEEPTALAGAIEAMQEGLITPILVGNRDQIINAANECQIDISSLEIVEAEGEQQSAHRGVDLVVEGRADALMKGHIHSDTYLSAVIRRENGLRTKNRTSHCFVMDIPHWPKPVIITDAALNIAPDLNIKKSIIENAIELACAIGVNEPKVAVLSATEAANPAIPSSVEADELSKITFEGAKVDGPFALDNAVNTQAAELKGIQSPVAGQADILVVPTIEAGNIFFKALTFMAGSETAGLVVGAKAPVILTSRADSADARIASCALAVLYAERLNERN